MDALGGLERWLWLSGLYEAPATAPQLVLNQPLPVLIQPVSPAEPPIKKRKLHPEIAPVIDITDDAIDLRPAIPPAPAPGADVPRPRAAIRLQQPRAVAPSKNRVFHAPVLPTYQAPPPIYQDAPIFQQNRRQLSTYQTGPAHTGPALEFDAIYPGFENALAYIQELLEYEFREPMLLKEALCGTKMAIAIGERVTQSNQRLAIIGDAALRMAIWDTWYWKGGETCGETDRKFSQVACNNNLREVGRMHGIDQYIYTIGGGSNKAVADAVEAIIGAVWMDSNKCILKVKGVVGILLGIELISPAS